MDKSILNEYIDACELVKETESDIHRLENRRAKMVQDSVKGSMPDFPYAQKNFHLEGIEVCGTGESPELRRERMLLLERKKKAESLQRNVQEFISQAPFRIQRIFRMKYVENMSWQQVADRMGRKATENSIKKEFHRFIHKK